MPRSALSADNGVIGEDPFVFIFIKVWNVVLVLFFADTTFTAVAADELTAAGEFVDSKSAVVGTALAVGHSCSIL